MLQLKHYSTGIFLFFLNWRGYYYNRNCQWTWKEWYTVVFGLTVMHLTISSLCVNYSVKLSICCTLHGNGCSNQRWHTLAHIHTPADFFVSPAVVYENENAAYIMGNKALGSLARCVPLLFFLTKAVVTFHIFTTQIPINSRWKNTYLAPLSIWIAPHFT